MLNRVVGRRLICVYVVGRKSGRRFVVPVAYTRHGDSLLVGTPFAWGRNLRTGEPVDVLLKGKRRSVDVEAFRDEAGVVDLYGVMAHDNRAFARFNKIGTDSHGRPDAGDLHRAWAAGARAFRFTPR